MFFDILVQEPQPYEIAAVCSRNRKIYLFDPPPPNTCMATHCQMMRRPTTIAPPNHLSQRNNRRERPLQHS